MRAAIRYLRRAVSAILLIVFLCVLAVLVLSRTAFLKQFVRDKVVAFVAANYHGTLTIARIEGSVWGSLRLDQVALREHGKTIAFIPQLSIDYSLVPLLWRTLHLQIGVSSPVIEAERDPNGGWNVLHALSARVPSPPSTAKRSLTIDVDSVQVSRGSLQIVPSRGGPTYRVTNLDLNVAVTMPASGMTVNLRRLTGNIAAPKMPMLYAAVALDYDAVVSPARVRLRDVELRTQQSTITILGDAALGRMPRLDLSLLMRRLAAADVARLYPASQLKADLGGVITIRGPENSLHSIIDLNFAGATLKGTLDADAASKVVPYAVKLKLSNADAQKIVRTTSMAGVVDATVNAKGTGADLESANADVQLHGRNLKAKQYSLGTLDLAATASNKNAHLVLTLAAPSGYLTVRGTSTIASNPGYHVELAAQQLNLAQAGFGANSGQTNLNLNAVIDGHGVAPLVADTGIRLTVDRSHLGQILIDRGFLDARLKNYRVNIAHLHFAAAGSSLDAFGSAGLASSALSNVSYELRSQNLSQVLALARMKGHGTLDVRGEVSGPRSALWSRGTVRLSSFQTGGYSLEQGSTLYQVAVTGPGAPYGQIDANFNRVKAGTEFSNLSLRLNASPGVPHAIALQLKLTDSAGRKDSVVTRLIYRPPSLAGQLTEMTLGLPTGNWHLIAPVEYKRDPRSLSISRLELQSGSRQLVLQGTIAQQGPQDFSLVVNRFDLAALQTITPRLHQVHGLLSTRLQVMGTAAAPIINLAVQAVEVGIGRQPLGNLDTRVSYAEERAAFQMTLEQDPADRLLASGSMPMSLSWNNGVKSKIGGAIDGTVNSPRLNLAQLASLFPDDVRNFQGVLAINLRVHGSLKQPQASGSVRITGVRGQIVPLGVTISSAQILTELDPSAVRIQTIEADSGPGRISGNGIIGLQQYAPSTLEVNLTFKQWPAINTEQYAANLGGDIAVDGSLSHPRVHGRLEVLNGTIQPDLGFLTATSNLSPDETIEVIQPGQSIPHSSKVASPGGYSPPQQPSTFNNLAMKIKIIIHRNTWIRNPDAAAELEGNLDVDKDPGGPIRVVGEVRTVRGWINYYNREFTLKTGVFTFTGGSKIDPSLDIDAQYLVTNYTIDIVVGGTASKPTLQFKSQPELAQADILSLILFGKTTDALGQGQQASLQQQATKMATGAAARQIGQAVASSMGLQSLGLTFNNAGSTGPAVGIGHYLGENTYVSASQSIGGSGGQKLSVQYFLLRWLSITTSSAADGSHEIDLNLVKQY